MAVQQLMMAQKIVAGGGSGLPPNTYAGLQLWISPRELATLYQSRNDSIAASSDGDPVNRLDSISPTTRCVVDGALDDQYRLQLAEIAGENTFDYVHVPTSSPPEIYTKPATGVNPSAVTLRTAIKAAGAGTYIFSGVVHASAAISTQGACSKILSGTGGEWGIEFYETSGTIYFRHYNFDSGGYDEIVSAGVAAGTPVVVSFRHNSNAIRVRINGGTFSSIASTNTQDFGSTVPVCAWRNGDDVDVMDIAAWNVALSDANLLEVEKWLGAKLGITI